MLHNNLNEVEGSSNIYETNGRLLETEEYENIGAARNLFHQTKLLKTLQDAGSQISESGFAVCSFRYNCNWTSSKQS